MKWTYTVLDPLAAEPLPNSITHGVGEYFAERALFQDLNQWARQLRCPYEDGGNLILDKTKVSDADRAAMRLYFPKLLHEFQVRRAHPSRQTSVLVGVAAHVFGNDYPATEQEACSLADAVLFYVGDYESDSIYDVFAQSYILDLLNRWLKPAVPWHDLPGVVTICRHMFGEAWCDLILSTNYRDAVGPVNRLSQGIDLDIIKKRPSFLPGLCPEQDSETIISLPDNMGPCL
jgi:hypothetical protein